ncbi:MULTISPECIES: hypothetical protein [unclassified Ruminococcus]|uniref:hypothetical protein n=1 Tax=unclassified Ruminococcus TaxID=2608920 RepID=UPI00210ED303|nr:MULTISPECIES: hypothetical protein [unclassified Ruminococcus]MCQ4021740.1 hypothetical protein [Ruminococcus sp. zg-924]MCQ4114184.1 hypothetical protein [Ruminococcus sp. zg-921]
MNELLKKLGDYFIENQRVADTAEIQEVFGIQSRGTVLQAIKQLHTVGLLDDKNNVVLDSVEFAGAMAEHNKNFPDITISRELINEENDKAVKTRVPGTYGEKVRYMWLSKDNITEINDGKTLLSFVDLNRDYKLYGTQNEVVQTISGSELYSHYSEVSDKVRSRLNTQNKQNGFVLGELGDNKSFNTNRDVSPMAKAVVFELTDTLAKLEDEHSVPQEERLTDWFADYSMNIPRGGINSETVNKLQNRIAELSSREKLQETLQQENVVNKKTAESPLRNETLQPEQRPETVDLPVKTAVLAGLYDRATSNLISLQDKNTKLAMKNDAAAEKLNRTRSFIKRCDSLISSSVLPAPVNAFLKIISEQQHEKAASLENKISSRNLKMQKNDLKIQKYEQKIDTYKKLDTFLQNMKSPDGRRENFILGLSEFKDISIKRTTEKIVTVNEKIATAQDTLNTTRFIQEKMKLQNKLAALNIKKEKFEAKLDKLNQFDEKLNYVKSASEQTAENIVSKSYDGIVNSIAENPAEFAKNPEDKVVDVCGETIDSSIAEQNHKQEKLTPQHSHQPQRNNNEVKKEKAAFPMSRNQLKKNAQTIAHNKPEQQQNKNRSHGQEL